MTNVCSLFLSIMLPFTPACQPSTQNHRQSWSNIFSWAEIYLLWSDMMFFFFNLWVSAKNKQTLGGDLLHFLCVSAPVEFYQVESESDGLNHCSTNDFSLVTELFLHNSTGERTVILVQRLNQVRSVWAPNKGKPMWWCDDNRSMKTNTVY